MTFQVVCPSGWVSWFYNFFQEVVAALHERHGSKRKWPLDEFEAILRAGEQRAELLVPASLDPEALQTPTGGYGYYYAAQLHPIFSGWDAYYGRHTEAVRDILQSGDANTRVHALERLRDGDPSLPASGLPHLTVVTDLDPGAGG